MKKKSYVLLEDKKLRSFIKKKLKSRGRTLIGRKIQPMTKWEKYRFMLAIFVFSFMGTSGVLSYINKPETEHQVSIEVSIGYISFALAWMCLYSFAQLRRSKSPKLSEHRDKWFWENGRKLILSLSSVAAFSLLAITLFKWGNYGIRSTSLVSMIFFSISFFIFLLILKNPTLFFSKALTFLGNIAVFTSGFLWVILVIWATLKMPFGIYMLPLLLYAVIRYYLPTFTALFFLAFHKPRVGLIQRFCLKVIHPKTLLRAFKSTPELFEERSKALKIIADLEQKADFGTQLALMEYLNEKYEATNGKKSNILETSIGLLLALMLFIIASIGEGFFQDIMYEPAKKYLCESYNKLC